jgi:hypothetical protein
VTESLQRSDEFETAGARLRVDVLGSKPRDQLLEDMSFLNYRLGEAALHSEVTLADPDILIREDRPKGVEWAGGQLLFDGPWPAGPIQKSIVSLLALKLEGLGLHPFHSSAVRYRDRTVLFLGGESNHGKTMGQVEACRRGGLLISTETTIIDEDGRAVLGSKSVFLKKRTEGTERADKAAPEAGVDKFFGGLPSWEVWTEPSKVDLVIVPAIDGNFDPSLAEMIAFERQFQAFHSVQNYFLTNELLAPGFPMPLLDRDPLRRARAAFIERFCSRPFFFVRAATPQVLLDEVDRIL